MTIHELKIQHQYLIDIKNGFKTFELRKNDRGYKVGDLIKFIDLGKKRIKADSTLYKITYILKDVPQYGLSEDYCILGIKKINIVEV